MSRKGSAVGEKHPPRATAESCASAREEKAELKGDFWGNLIYFTLLTTAITFILANNSREALTGTAGIVILGILTLLDIFPAINLFKHWLSKRD